jgi:DNA-binding transcriptional MerR regulator
MAARGTRQGTLTIGQFARASGLSPKALRLYDLSGLLPPADVDPVNGYRHYTADQLERARRISLLRQLEMPLATVAEVLASTDDEAVSRLDRWWHAQEASMRAKRGTFEFLRTELTRPGQPATSYPVSLREVAETKVATIQRDVDQQALVTTMMTSQDQITRHLRAAGAELAGEAWWIFHGVVTPDSEAPVEVGVPFTGTVDPAGPITIRIEPAHTEAFVTVTRDECIFPRIMVAYDAVTAWVRQSGLPEVGSPREVYFADCEMATGDDPFAHVAQPVASAPAPPRMG